MATQGVEATANAPANPSPLNPNASTSSAPRRSLERTLPTPATYVVGSASTTPPENIAGDSLKKDTGAKPQPSLREALGRVRAGLGDGGPGTALSPTTAGGTLSPLGGGRVTQQQQAALERERQQNAVDRTDAVWAEMQQTLRDVELSASVGTHFFGRGHPTALEELRNAQIALAQAWARGAAQGSSSSGGGAADASANETAAEPKEKDKSADTSSQKSPRASVSEADGDETEADMAAARRRREASDRYFERVSKHVGEVTKKLEDVAVAMGKVEEESREGWSESDNLDSASQTS